MRYWGKKIQQPKFKTHTMDFWELKLRISKGEYKSEEMIWNTSWRKTRKQRTR